MNRYKSWSALKKELESRLCLALQGKLTYFLTRYHKVHDSYGRVAIRLDDKELLCFSWIEGYLQEGDVSRMWKDEPTPVSFTAYEKIREKLKPQWDENCTYCEGDFLNAALNFLDLPIAEALNSENYIVKILAVLDKRVGKRTLMRLISEGKYKNYPHWVRPFYELRFTVEKIEEEKSI